MSFLWVFLGGGIGSLLRYGFARLLGNIGVILPVHTLVANILACLLLGVITGFSLAAKQSDFQKYFIAVGICGGFSTFSTFANEIVKLNQSDNFTISIVYMVTSLLLGVFAIIGGILISKYLMQF